MNSNGSKITRPPPFDRSAYARSASVQAITRDMRNQRQRFDSFTYPANFDEVPDSMIIVTSLTDASFEIDPTDVLVHMAAENSKLVKVGDVILALVRSGISDAEARSIGIDDRKPKDIFDCGNIEEIAGSLQGHTILPMNEYLGSSIIQPDSCVEGISVVAWERLNKGKEFYKKVGETDPSIPKRSAADLHSDSDSGSSLRFVGKRAKCSPYQQKGDTAAEEEAGKSSEAELESMVETSSIGQVENEDEHNGALDGAEADESSSAITALFPIFDPKDFSLYEDPEIDF
ncbi:hypothetical protein BDV96DRAFT_605294 [Lophiotrema nucula]|uniref:Uncharacterized protein n=1 Tax=Lophiotrema nucula TaxID=690887 RepID=A0A6A5YRZ6_9PLEO|nr:hypothetical protein BDV96DRAFT_605294 [Lophiotrema nucula]